jgi:hypothetical protein
MSAKIHVSLAAFLVLSSSALAGPPFVTDDPEPVDYLHWELYTFSQLDFTDFMPGSRAFL